MQFISRGEIPHGTANLGRTKHRSFNAFKMAAKLIAREKEMDKTLVPNPNRYRRCCAVSTESIRRSAVDSQNKLQRHFFYCGSATLRKEGSPKERWTLGYVSSRAIRALVFVTLLFKTGTLFRSQGSTPLMLSISPLPSRGGSG